MNKGPKPWTDEEISYIVPSYFDMLNKEMSGVSYSKAEHKREVIDKLNNRNDASIEYKYRNISAILEEEGLPFIKGFLPMSNYQKALKEPVLNIAKKIYMLPVNIDEILQDVYSWTLLNPNELIKHIDMSSIKYNGSAVPKELHSFFGINTSTNPVKTLNAVLNCTELTLKVQIDELDRVRIFWSKKLSEEIERKYPKQCELIRQGKTLDEVEVLIKFTREEGKPFDISLLSLSDNDSVIPEEYAGNYEGGVTEGSYLRRVRNGENRRKAIEGHGLKCMVCGFNFEEAYGELGKGFIEIHHITPLSKVNEGVLINPEKDLVPLCANCHRMIHRMGTEMSIDKLKEIWWAMSEK